MKRLTLCCLLLFLSACAHQFKAFDPDGNLLRHIESHWDYIEYEDEAGKFKLMAKDNLSGWELILPAIVQKAPAVQIGDVD